MYVGTCKNVTSILTNLSTIQNGDGDLRTASLLFLNARSDRKARLTMKYFI